MIVDTDVIIWYMRGNEKAKAIIDKLGPFNISSVTYMELIQGIRNKNELNSLKKFIKIRSIKCINLDSEITSRAIYFMELYSLSHGLRMADALIAATTDVTGETLLTGNHSHYRMVPTLSIKKFKHL